MMCDEIFRGGEENYYVNEFVVQVGIQLSKNVQK